MYLRDVLNITGAESFSPDIDLDSVVTCGFASDLMSDVLRYDMTQGLLVTGLANPQVVRTAEMADVAAILMARGKVPPPETIQLAREIGIPILGTHMIMFETCGRLYAAGLPASRPHNGHS
jgi:hypothetical protein